MSLNVEEDTPTAREFSGADPATSVIIDPIDGTLRYLRGDGPYAILVGLEREGRVEAALVGLPQSETMLRAVRGGGVEIAVRGRPFEPARLQGDGSEVLVSYGLPILVQERLRSEGLELTTAAGGVIGVAPLLPGVHGAIRLSANAEGLSCRAWVAALPLLEAGGRVQTLEGALPERYEAGVAGIVVAANDATLSNLQRALS